MLLDKKQKQYIFKSDSSVSYGLEFENQIKFRENYTAGELIRHSFLNQDLSELFHENIKVRRDIDIDYSIAVSKRVVDPRFLSVIAYSGMIRYSSKLIELPKPYKLDVNFSDVIINRRSIRSYTGEPLTLKELATILYYSIGLTGSIKIKIDDLDIEKPLLAVPSAGGLNSSEIFIYSVNVEGLDNAFYRYIPYHHSLELIRKINKDDVFNSYTVHPYIIDLSTASVIFVLVAYFYRDKIKYGQIGYKYSLVNVGHLAQNITLVSTALNLGSCPIMGFYEDEINELLGFDGITISAIYNVVVGKPKR